MSNQSKSKYLHNLKSRAKHRYGNECLLSLDDLDLLLNEAGITMDDIGRGINDYHLARYNDTGNYEMGNCRFITARENYAEKVNNYVRVPKVRVPKPKSSTDSPLVRRQKESIRKWKARQYTYIGQENRQETISRRYLDATYLQ